MGKRGSIGGIFKPQEVDKTLSTGGVYKKTLCLYLDAKR